jgi:hypothetical protein
VSEFNKSKTGRLGVASVCKVCCVEYRRKYYATNKSKLLAQTKKYHQDNHEKAREWKRSWEIRNKAQIAERKRKYERENPHVKRAHARVRDAVATGKLIPMPCEVCGKSPGQAHHDDYSKPLDVRWLCSKHHNLLHSIERSELGVISSSAPETAAASEPQAD